MPQPHRAVYRRSAERSPTDISERVDALDTRSPYGSSVGAGGARSAIRFATLLTRGIAAIHI
jgi:hypothetical protein